MEQSALNIAASQQMDGNYMLEKKFEIMIGTATKKILTEIMAIKESLANLQNDISDVKRARSQSSSSSPYSSAANVPSNGAALSSNNERFSSAPKPRFGDYKPEDVSVDKFFYFGKK